MPGMLLNLTLHMHTQKQMKHRIEYKTQYGKQVCPLIYSPSVYNYINMSATSYLGEHDAYEWVKLQIYRKRLGMEKNPHELFLGFYTYRWGGTKM